MERIVKKYKPVLCKICGKEFIKTGTRSLYCSKPCFLIKEHIRNKKRWAKEHEKKNKLVKCRVCGNDFWTARRLHLYCSFKCRKKGRKLYRINYELLNKEIIKKRNRKYWKNNAVGLRKSRTIYRIEHLEKGRLYCKRYRKRHPEKVKLTYKLLRLKFPEKIRARDKAHRKIKIPYGQICEKCKKNKAMHRHHTDYSKPLKVKFLCVSCHAKETIKEKINVRKTRPNSIKSKQGLKLIATC